MFYYLNPHYRQERRDRKGGVRGGKGREEEERKRKKLALRSRKYSNFYSYEGKFSQTSAFEIMIQEILTTSKNT